MEITKEILSQYRDIQEEIEKMRAKTNSYWSMVTNTCYGFLTLVCC